MTTRKKNQRDALEIENFLARSDVAESGAFSLEDAAHLASIGSSIISAGESLFGG